MFEIISLFSLFCGLARDQGKESEPRGFFFFFDLKLSGFSLLPLPEIGIIVIIYVSCDQQAGYERNFCLSFVRFSIKIYDISS